MPGGGRGRGGGGRGRGGGGGGRGQGNRQSARRPDQNGGNDREREQQPSPPRPQPEADQRDAAQGMANAPSTALGQLKFEAQALEEQLEAMRSRITTMESQREHVVARVDDRLCSQCGICVSICPNEAITIEEKVVIDSTRCSGCGVCVCQCPSNALQLVQDRQSA